MTYELFNHICARYSLLNEWFSSFASAALSLFGSLIGILWLQFYDPESAVEGYYAYWFALTWWTSVELTFNAAWSTTFSIRALQHAGSLAEADVTPGIASTVFVWIFFVATVNSALAAIQWSVDYTQKATTDLKLQWKAPYFDLIEPRKGITMKIINEYQNNDEGSIKFTTRCLFYNYQPQSWDCTLSC